MKLESFSLSCKLQSFSPPNSSPGVRFLHGSRVLRVSWPKIQLLKITQKNHEVPLAMATWICIFLTSQILPNFYKKCSSVCNFRQPYVPYVCIEYNKVSQFLQFFKWRGQLVCGVHLVEVAVKFGVLLVVSRNEARKSLRNPASCSILIGAFDARKFIEKENGRLQIFEAIFCTLLHPPFMWLDLHLQPSISLKEIQN